MAKIEIYTKHYCPHCKAAKHTLKRLGLAYREIEVSAWVRTVNVNAGPGEDMTPMIAISFYDDQRGPRGQQWLGPWIGTSEWQRVSKKLRVPASAKEGIFRVGLFGATGEFSVDGITVTPIAR